MRLSSFLPSSLAFVALTASALTTGCTVHATVGEATSAHPAYLHALSDLRDARANIDGRGGNATAQTAEGNAIGAIDRAIADLKQAAIDDGRNTNDHPAVDMSGPPQGRLHRAVAALEKARGDINSEEDNPNARALRQRALGDIDAAINETNHALAQF